jgi:lactate dehydrogenase-like 2-hydroxyacid dehydrogenase
MRKEAAQEWRIIMKILMLDASTYGEDVNIDKFYALGEVKSYSTSTREEALKRVAEHNPDVVIINKIAADKEFIDAAPALKMIAETATGYNNIDIMYAKEKNIRVANVAGYSTDSVVQHTFALGLYLVEKMSYYDGYVKSGEYAKCPIFSHFSNVFHELTGKTWGIVGLGTIGKGVAKIAADFGCKVIYYSASGKTQEVPYERKELDEFLKESDIISIHAPLNEKTQNLFDAAAFDKMKTSAILLNLGRGPIVNDTDLAEALADGKIAAAGLDVLGKEPIEADNPLMEIKDSTKLVITPHVAWGTVEARTRLMDEVYENIAAFSKGEKRNVVS